MTNFWQDPTVWALAVGVAVAATAITRQRITIKALRRQKQGFQGELNASQGRVADLDSTVTELRSGYDEVVRQAKEEAEEATNTVLKSAMRTLQGLAAEQQRAISGLQKKYGDSTVLRDMLDIDHMNSQFNRRAQSIAVLCGGWLGRQREAAAVYDVIRGAQGRIRHYQRIEIASRVDFAVTSRAVEPIALTVAELLDNATSYSDPSTMVEVEVRTVPRGICIVIDDAGVGMSEEERTNATALLTSGSAVSVSDLGNPPAFGFAVIGALCARFGFTVAIDSTSPYGGVRAVVMVPKELLTEMPEPKSPTSTQEINAAASRGSALAATEGGLPRRRNKRGMALVPDGGRRSDEAPPARSPEARVAAMGAFQRGTLSGRGAGGPAAEGDTAADSHEGFDAP
ncbi:MULTISPECIES: ATP-binding protein [unclassified Streptomyces]|uniref:ATP-binding protein n=1 Tax=unclassified Streptomyces TaxID=2593676 RepID=UPI0003A0D249|nr:MULTISPECIES: ATP-binding protein [unclassified Streptomyces]MYY00795.1 ATP-binding protein [Streptomyces sp. SID4913]